MSAGLDAGLPTGPGGGAQRPGHHGPSAWPTRVGAQARADTVALLRNGEQLLVVLVLPAVLLVTLTSTALGDVLPEPGSVGADARVDLVAPGVLALAVMSVAFTGQAIATGFDRRAGVLRLLGTTPLGRGGLVAGRVLAVLVVEVVQLVVLGGLALALGWRPLPAGLPVAALVLVLGTAAFVGLGLLLAGTLRAEGVLATANLVWVALLVAGGVVVPAGALPAPLDGVATWLPSGALGEGMRSALAAGHLPVVPLLVLLAWALAAGAAAVRWFRWDG